jgi:hypothetical protein
MVEQNHSLHEPGIKEKEEVARWPFQRHPPSDLRTFCKTPSVNCSTQSYNTWVIEGHSTSKLWQEVWLTQLPSRGQGQDGTRCELIPGSLVLLPYTAFCKLMTGDFHSDSNMVICGASKAQNVKHWATHHVFSSKLTRLLCYCWCFDIATHACKRSWEM